MTQYWSLGIDIKTTVNENGLVGLNVDDNGDLSLVGETVALEDDETFSYWTDEQIEFVKQQVIFALKGAKRFARIDETTLDIITEDGDYIGDQEFGSIAPYLVGYYLDQDREAMLQYDIESTLAKLSTLDNIEVINIDKQDDTLQIDIEAKLINSNNYVNLRVII